MFLSRVELDVTRRSTMKALAAPQMLHGAVESAFPGERRRRLWRLDHLYEKTYLIILSEDVPDLSHIAAQFGVPGTQGETKNYDPLLERITDGSRWRFRLTANPTVSKSGTQHGQERGKVLAHCSTQYQEQWLLNRASQHGFILDPDAFAVTASKWLRFQKGSGGHPITILSVTYEGVLQVSDADRFRAMLVNGIGRGKAYGQGLMTVMRYG